MSGADRGSQVLDKLVLGGEVVDLVRPVRGSPVERRVAEPLASGQVLAEDVGQQREEQVVERLEPAAERDRLGERDVGLDLEVLGGDPPGRASSPTAAVGLVGGEPPDLLRPRDAGRGQLAARRGAATQSAATQPKIGWFTYPLLELADGERRGPAAFVRHVTRAAAAPRRDRAAGRGPRGGTTPASA